MVRAVASSPGGVDLVLTSSQDLSPLAGLQLEVMYDPRALTIQGIGPGADNARLDTVLDNHASRAAMLSGTFVVATADSRRLPILPGAVIHLSYAERKPGRTHLELSAATLATSDGQRLTAATEGTDLVLP